MHRAAQSNLAKAQDDLSAGAAELTALRTERQQLRDALQQREGEVAQLVRRHWGCWTRLLPSHDAVG